MTGVQFTDRPNEGYHSPMRNLWPSPWMWREKTKWCWQCKCRRPHRVWGFSFDWMAVVATLTLFSTLPVLIWLFLFDRIRRWKCEACGAKSYV